MRSKTIDERKVAEEFLAGLREAGFAGCDLQTSDRPDVSFLVGSERIYVELCRYREVCHYNEVWQHDQELKRIYRERLELRPELQEWTLRMSYFEERRERSYDDLGAISDGESRLRAPKVPKKREDQQGVADALVRFLADKVRVATPIEKNADPILRRYCERLVVQSHPGTKMLDLWTSMGRHGGVDSSSIAHQISRKVQKASDYRRRVGMSKLWLLYYTEHQPPTAHPIGPNTRQLVISAIQRALPAGHDFDSVWWFNRYEREAPVRVFPYG